ncbi:MAG: Rieske (2Fe-2S) protein [Solirubrobacterales bacterium]
MTASLTVPMAEVLCDLAEIADPGSKEFAVEADGRRQSVFVVRRGDEVFGYINSCPHIGAPLNWEPDKFLDLSGEEIVCSMHGAHFDIESGACLMGPCPGKSLRSYDVVVRDGKVVHAPSTKGI